MITSSQIITSIKAVTGIGVIEMTELAIITTPDTELIKAVAQVLIAIATIISIFVKKKEKAKDK